MNRRRVLRKTGNNARKPPRSRSMPDRGGWNCVESIKPRAAPSNGQGNWTAATSKKPIGTGRDWLFIDGSFGLFAQISLPSHSSPRHIPRRVTLHVRHHVSTVSKAEIPHPAICAEDNPPRLNIHEWSCVGNHSLPALAAPCPDFS